MYLMLINIILFRFVDIFLCGHRLLYYGTDDLSLGQGEENLKYMCTDTNK